MLHRAVFVAGAALAAMPGLLGGTGQACHPPPMIVARPNRREIAFLKGTQPLLDLEWWAVEALRCRFRTARWQAAIEERIAHESADAAKLLWPGDGKRQEQALSIFTAAQAEARREAEFASRLQCAALLATGKLGELDHIAKAGGW